MKTIAAAEVAALRAYAERQTRLAHKGNRVCHVSAEQLLALLDAAERCATAEAERDKLRADLDAAAGDLPVPIPEPGTDTAKLLLANVLMRRELAHLRALRASNEHATDGAGGLVEQLRVARAELERLRPVARALGEVEEAYASGWGCDPYGEGFRRADRDLDRARRGLRENWRDVLAALSTETRAALENDDG